MNIRNIAIIAHVDHGKTTLVDRLLQQTASDARTVVVERALDSNELERERGITILSKTTAVEHAGCRINIVDTPGHADFGGEVERILSMVDSVLLVVDAVEGPMPQTRFVTAKAFSAGLNPILVVNKIDRDSARPHEVVDEVFDLFDRLGATDEQLDFPVMFTSAALGVAGPDPEHPAPDMTPLLDLIVERVPPPDADTGGAFQMQISTLDYSSYVGVIGIGRVKRGSLLPRSQVAVVNTAGEARRGRVLSVLASRGLERVELPEARAGDIVCIIGIDDVGVSDTLCDLDAVQALPPLAVDDPTLTMTFCVNTSPFAGLESRFLTSRQLKSRLFREASHNVALRVEETADPDRFQVSGRRRAAPLGADRDDAPRGLRARGVEALGDHPGSERSASGALRVRGLRRRSPPSGPADGGDRRAQGGVPGHRERRRGAGAAHLQDRDAGAHGLSQRVHVSHIGVRHHDVLVGGP